MTDAQGGLFDAPPPLAPPPGRGAGGARRDLPLVTVSELTRSVKTVIASTFPRVRVVGEITNVRRSPPGHTYFSLKDDGAQVTCVLFVSAQARVTIAPADGLACEVRGAMTVYEKNGTYQLVADEVIPHGAGALMVAYEKLAARLLGEGLFRAERKRPLPRYPRTIGVVTSPTGAAVRDVIRIVHQRMPSARIVVIPALVQGASAAPSIVRGIALANRRADIDVLIVGRGGGSIEDLWAFNEEAVVRAIVASRIPVISAVGHERDVTLADHAADVRAPTPSGAAQLAVRDAREVAGEIAQRVRRLRTAMAAGVASRRTALEHLTARYGFRQPRDLLQQRTQRVDDLHAALHVHVRHALARARGALESGARHVRTSGRAGLRLAERTRALDRAAEAVWRCTRTSLDDRRARIARFEQTLHALGPENVLARGYAILEHADGGVITRSADVRPPEAIRLTLADGVIHAHADSVHEDASPLVSRAPRAENARAPGPSATDASHTGDPS